MLFRTLSASAPARVICSYPRRRQRFDALLLIPKIAVSGRPASMQTIPATARSAESVSRRSVYLALIIEHPPLGPASRT
jgi:hypothetical protein